MTLWVFVYGSLMWNPGFDYEEQFIARLPGYHRSFCMLSIHHRGSEEDPGLVLALDTQSGGQCTGVAFQVADDLRDALCDEDTLGKPAGQDDLHGRPNAVASLGVQGAIQRFDDILSGAISSIPACPGEAALAQMVRAYADKLVPDGARRRPTVPGE